MLILEKKPMSFTSERFKILRSNIQYSSFDKPLKSIVITSAEKNEGKSTVSSNLAVSFAQEGKKVVLLDCDLRKPILHKKFGISNSIGLSELLLGSASLDKVLFLHSSGVSVIPSGKIPPNPSEMLSSKAMENLIASLISKYDYLIIDTPPLNAVTDAKILSTKVDGTILVVKYGSTKKHSVLEAIKSLKVVDSHIIGSVFNYEAIGKSSYYNYYKSNTKRR